ncbi:MAG: hypothetical protein WAW88_14690, partial [Nocardioides sp.]
VVDRAGAARARAQRSRRRRVAWAATTLAAVATVAVGVTALVQQREVDPPVFETLPAGAPPVIDCPDAPTSLDTTPATGELPRGAVAVRLCPTRGSGASGLWAGPAELLTTGVDELIAVINSQQAPPPSGVGCTSDGGWSYSLAFAYPDGVTRVVHGEQFGCYWVRIEGDGIRFGAGPVWQAARAAWGAQRAEQRPTMTPNPPDCGALIGRGDPPALSPFAAPEDMVQAALCVSVEGAGPLPGVQKQVPQALLTRVVDAYLRQRTPLRKSASCETDPASGRDIVQLLGVTPWGDRVLLSSACAGRLWHVNAIDDARGYVWRPDDALASELMALVDSAAETAEPNAPEDKALPADIVTAYLNNLALQRRDGSSVRILSTQDLPTFQSHRYATKVRALRTSPTGEERELEFILVRDFASQPWRILGQREIGPD